VQERRLGWEVRYKVAVGLCKALEYSHNGSPQEVIHLNVKPSNILLSHDFQSQVFPTFDNQEQDWPFKEHNLHDLYVFLLKNCSSSED
jgi:serine/threonine protein kinase